MTQPDLEQSILELLVNADLLRACDQHGIFYRTSAISLDDVVRAVADDAAALLPEWSAEEIADAIRREFRERGAREFCALCRVQTLD
jgi:hypothetical protein